MKNDYFVETISITDSNDTSVVSIRNGMVSNLRNLVRGIRINTQPSCDAKVTVTKASGKINIAVRAVTKRGDSALREADANNKGRELALLGIGR